MAILEVTRRWSDRTGSDAIDNRNYNHVYDVLVSDGNVSEVDVLSDSRIPQVGQTMTTPGGIDSGVTVRNRIPRSVGPAMWEVQVIYGTTATGGSFKDLHPLSRPPKYRYGFDISEEEIDQDVDGKPIATANGEPLRGVKEEFADQTITIIRNEAMIDLTTIRKYANAVNSDDFYGAQPGMAKMRPIAAEDMWEDWKNTRVHYYVVTYQVVFREPIGDQDPARVWERRLLHRGYLIKATINGTERIVHATDDHGQPVSEPVLLTADGRKAGTSADRFASASWLSFQTRPALPFNVWGL